MLTDHNNPPGAQQAAIAESLKAYRDSALGNLYNAYVWATPTSTDAATAEVLRRVSGFYARHGGTRAPDSAGMPQEKILITYFDAVSNACGVRAASAAIHGEIVDLLIDAKFDECDRVLSSLNIESTNPDLLLSYVVATVNAPRQMLPSRVELMRRTRLRFVREFGGDETAMILDRFE